MLDAEYDSSNASIFSPITQPVRTCVRVFFNGQVWIAGGTGKKDMTTRPTYVPERFQSFGSEASETAWS